MSGLELYGMQSAMLSPRTSRGAARALGKIQGSSAIDIARIDAAAQRHEAVVDGVTTVTVRAMQHVSVVAQGEQQMALMTPAASGRLAAVADTHALAMTGIVMDTERALRRLA